MEHRFDPDIATKYGLNEAIILQNIAYWVDNNEKNERNFYDGRYWTYNSAKAFKEQFPYMSVRTIQRVLKHLVDAGLILSGKYSPEPRNQTHYYALTDYGASLTTKWRVALCQNGNMDNAKMAECIFNKNTDSKTNINSTNINTISAPVISAESARKSELFETFWKAYPKKVDKKGCEKKFIKIPNLEQIFPDIMAALEEQKRSKQWNEEKGQYIPHPSTWINQERWNLVNEVEGLQMSIEDAVSDDIDGFTL